MTRRVAIPLFAALMAAVAARAEEVVVDFEQAQVGKPMPEWS